MDYNDRKIRMDQVEQFATFCRMKQSEIIKYTIEKLKLLDFAPKFGDGYIFVNGETPVLLIASIETRFNKLPKNIGTDSYGKILMPIKGQFEFYSCSIYAALKIVETTRCSLLVITEHEGIGGHRSFVGSDDGIAVRNKFNCIIELDYSGEDWRTVLNATYFVGAEYGENESFVEYVKEYEFYSDYVFRNYQYITQISPVLEVAGMNVACGYVVEEKDPFSSRALKGKKTPLETHIDFDDLCSTIERLTALISNCKCSYPYLFEGENKEAQATLLFYEAAQLKKMNRNERRQREIEVAKKIKEFVE